CDTRALGRTVVALGGGRQRETDRIDLAVGISEIVPLGTQVSKGTPLARVHAAREDAARTAVRDIQASFQIGAEVSDAPLILGEIGP
ncbi:MAG: thymidine phosphorylase, partial [Pseudomonadota bacterium]